ncbi:MAG: hypothetical protein ACYTHK_17555 [Planctomycetota bacterium]|jgi:hypothetical protein
MRDFVTWGTALAFLLTALYAVTVRREVVTIGRSIGTLSRDVVELKRCNENHALEVSRLKSPGAVTKRAVTIGVAPATLNESEEK